MPKPKLYFMFQPGCSHCDRAKPIVTRLQNKYPGVIDVERVDITKTNWPPGVWAPTATPTFVLDRPGERLRKKEGTQTLKQLEDWIGLTAVGED